ncbi:carbon-nitrogen hydrolase family protein [Amylibacter sp.]|jgi:predicted amidohydrolase|nr:carbon-nitrogen hydrolase family protein [Amylibacter sp.]
MTSLRLLACQINVPTMTTVHERDAHLDTLVEKVDAELENAPTDVVVLPELTTLDYARATFEELDTLAEPLDGSSFQKWSGLAQKHNCHVVYGLARHDSGRDFISTAAVSPDGKLIGHYDKLHLCHYGAGMEKDYFTAGDHIFTFTVNGIKLAPIICYDIRIPELCRTLTLTHNVDVILHCGAYFRDESFATWHAFAQTRAMENQIYLLSLNRAGENYGNSLFCPPWMDDLTPPTQFPEHAEMLKRLKIDRQIIAETRKNYTFLADRHKDYTAL